MSRREERRQLAYDFDLVAPGAGGDGLGLYVDGTRFVNVMAYLNSYDNLAPRANVKFVGARVNGWPVTLVLTAATVPPGAQFLADYGKGYYQEFYAEADGAAAAAGEAAAGEAAAVAAAAAGEAAAEMAEVAEAGELAEAPAAAAVGAARRPGRRAVAAPPGFYRERTQGGMVRPGPSGGRNA